MSYLPPPFIQSVTICDDSIFSTSLKSVHFSLTPSPAALFKAMLCLPWTALNAPHLILQLPGLFLFYSISRLLPEWASKKANFCYITFWTKTLPWFFFLRSYFLNLYLQYLAICGLRQSLQLSIFPNLMLYTSSTFSSYTGLRFLLSLVFCWNNLFCFPPLHILLNLWCLQ